MPKFSDDEKENSIESSVSHDDVDDTLECSPEKLNDAALEGEDVSSAVTNSEQCSVVGNPKPTNSRQRHPLRRGRLPQMGNPARCESSVVTSPNVSDVENDAIARMSALRQQSQSRDIKKTTEVVGGEQDDITRKRRHSPRDSKYDQLRKRNDKERTPRCHDGQNEKSTCSCGFFKKLKNKVLSIFGKKNTKNFCPRFKEDDSFRSGSRTVDNGARNRRYPRAQQNRRDGTKGRY